MKKSVLFVVAFAASIFSFAQGEEAKEEKVKQEIPNKSSNEIRSKRGHIILPQAGDLAIGFNTIPVIDFLLNSLGQVSIMGNAAPPANGAASDALTYTNETNNIIVGKYFIADDAALRFKFGYNRNNSHQTVAVQDAEAMASAVLGTQDDIDAASLIRVDDKLNSQRSNITLSVGYEKRRGYGRLQGFYGAEAGINWTKADAQVEYGNAFSDLHEVDYTNFNTNGTNATATLNPNSTNDAERVTSAEFDGGFGFGARAFIGVEYFFAPKISIAAEYGWGYVYTNTTKSTTTREVYHNGQAGPTILTEVENNGDSSSSHAWNVDNDGNSDAFDNTLDNTGLNGGSASITLLFHF